jgi:uncharacterized membrane protein
MDRGYCFCMSERPAPPGRGTKVHIVRFAVSLAPWIAVGVLVVIRPSILTSIATTARLTVVGVQPLASAAGASLQPALIGGAIGGTLIVLIATWAAFRG